MTKSCLVVGGGFRGIVASYLLRKQGMDVTLIEKAPHLGGIMFSREWNGFYVDNGVHLFDSIPKNLAAIVEEIMDGKIVPIDFNYASVYNSIVTPGLALPDLSHLDKATKATILYDLIERLTLPPAESCDTLYHRLLDLYGPTAADLLDASMRQIYRISTRELDPDSLRQTAFHRLRFLPDDMTLELKKHPELDKRLAALRAVVGKVDDFVSIYSGERGMRGFCEKSHEKLVSMGVDVRLSADIAQVEVDELARCIFSDGTSIEADHLFWAQDHGLLEKLWLGKESFKGYVHATPMVLFFFAVDKEKVHDYTYFHQFTPGSRVFRSSAAGIYSRQIRDDNKTYISVECPTDIGSEFWENPEQFIAEAWSECIEMDLIEEGTPLPDEFKILKAPVTHRLPKVGISDLCDSLDKKIAETNGIIIMPSRKAFTRRELMWSIEEALERVAAA